MGFVHTQKMVRVGVDENLAQELLVDFPRETEIVRIPRHPSGVLDVDFWIIPFALKSAQKTFQHLRGVKVVQSMMAGVDWITPWLPKEVVLCDGRGLHDISASEWVLTAILTSLKRFPYYRDMQLQREWKGQASVPNGFMDVGGAQVGQYAVLGDDLRKDGADCRVWLDRCVDRSSTEAIRGEEDSAGGTQRAEGT